MSAPAPALLRGASDDGAGASAPGPAEGGSEATASTSTRDVGLSTLVGGLAALWGLLIGLDRLYDNSFLTHLATGRLILDQGSIPTTDSYSFTAAGDPWVVQSWLASAIYAGAEEIGGFDGLRLVNGVLCGLLALAVWVLTSRSRSTLVRVAVVVGVLVPASDLWSGRPLLFGLLGLSVVLLVADGHIDPRWLVPVCWVWVNTHGSFPLALLVLGLLAVGRRLDDGSWGPEVRALRWAAVGIAAGAINPLGPRLLLFPLTLGAKTEAFRSIVEWQAPTYEAFAQIWVLGLLMLAVLGLVRMPRWRSALPAVVFAALALTSARNLAPLVLVLTPVLAGAVPRFGTDIDTIRRSSFRVGVVTLAAMGALVTVVTLSRPDVALGAYPEEPVAWMEEEGLWTSSSRVVAPDFVGNYREARRGAEANVFIDDRVDMYPPEVVDDYRVLQDADPGWPDVLADRDATAVLWQEDSPLGGALEISPDWRVVHRDTPWLVAVPASAP